MSLTPHQITLIQSSFSPLVDHIDEVASAFYDRLFELNPALKPLFKSDMTLQGRKMMQMLLYATNTLNNLPQLESQVQTLARRHIGYGIVREDYATVGAALLWTLEHGLGNAFDTETRNAWATMYQILADSAIEGAYLTT